MLGLGRPVGSLATDTQAHWLLGQHMTPSGTTKGTFGSFVLTLMLVQILSVGFLSLPLHVSSFLVSASEQTILHRLPVPAGVRAGTVRLGLPAPPGQSPRQHASSTGRRSTLASLFMAPKYFYHTPFNGHVKIRRNF